MAAKCSPSDSLVHLLFRSAILFNARSHTRLLAETEASPSRVEPSTWLSLVRSASKQTSSLGSRLFKLPLIKWSPWWRSDSPCSVGGVRDEKQSQPPSECRLLLEEARKGRPERPLYA